jgi:hypothetical protein
VGDFVGECKALFYSQISPNRLVLKVDQLDLFVAYLDHETTFLRH